MSMQKVIDEATEDFGKFIEAGAQNLTLNELAELTDALTKISEYQPEATTDKEKRSHRFRGNLYGAGAMTLLIGVVPQMAQDASVYGLAAAVSVAAGLLIASNRAYKKIEGSPPPRTDIEHMDDLDKAREIIVKALNVNGSEKLTYATSRGALLAIAKEHQQNIKGMSEQMNDGYGSALYDAMSSVMESSSISDDIKGALNIAAQSYFVIHTIWQNDPEDFENNWLLDDSESNFIDAMNDALGEGKDWGLQDNAVPSLADVARRLVRDRITITPDMVFDMEQDSHLGSSTKLLSPS